MIAEETSSQTPTTFDYTKEKAAYDKIIADFAEEVNKVADRRKVRENRRNVEEERKKGTILPDETIIPDRTINTNIKRGKGPYISYMTQAKRLLIITSVDQPGISVGTLEEWFTRGMRYPKWKIPWMRNADAFHLHGGSAMEVMYDPTKPLNVSVEYIARESLIIPKKTKNLQALPRLLREYELTTLQLEEFAEKYQFNPDAVQHLLEKFKDTENFIKIYRVLCKKGGIVYNAWYSRECQENTWLREPQIHDIGLKEFDMAALTAIQPDGLPLYMSPIWETPVPQAPALDETGMPLPEQPPQVSQREQMAAPMGLKEYPIYWFPYEITENETLLEGQGRAALDLHVQEALTHVVSNTVNATTRASGVYGSAENLDGMDSGLSELGVKIESGKIYSRKIAFFQPPWPNNIILAIEQTLRQNKANETGQTDYAAIARKDANKTATEMELATEQAQTNVNTDMDVYSSPVLDVLALQFKVATHQAIFNLCKRPTQPELLFGDYNLQPAGDIEVVKRAEDKANAKEFFNIVQGTPAAEKVLFFLIERFFPDQAEEWLAALAGPDKDAIIAQLVTVLQSIPTDELSPEQQSMLATLIATASSVVAGSNNEGLLRQSGQNNGGQPPPSNAPKQAPAE